MINQSGTENSKITYKHIDEGDREGHTQRNRDPWRRERRSALSRKQAKEKKKEI